MAIKYNRAVCDNDFDGIICAAMLRCVYPELELLFSEPSCIARCQFDFKVDEKTIVADLPYIQGCGLYFDHHASNQPKDEFNGVWRVSNSAAELVREYFKDQADLTQFDPVLADLARFDLGGFTLEDLTNPSQFMKFGFSIGRFHSNFGRRVAIKLAENEWEVVWQDEKVQKKVAIFEENHKNNSQFIREGVVMMSGLAVLNCLDVKLTGLHPIFVSQEFPDSLGVVLLKKKDDCVKVTMFRNNFKPETQKFDFLLIAKAINSAGAGGHKSGCGFDLPENMTVEDCLARIESEFSKQL